VQHTVHEYIDFGFGVHDQTADSPISRSIFEAHR
jgi:hypothetical protein